MLAMESVLILRTSFSRVFCFSSTLCMSVFTCVCVCGCECVVAMYVCICLCLSLPPTGGCVFCMFISLFVYLSVFVKTPKVVNRSFRNIYVGRV